MPSATEAPLQMVACQIAARGVTDQRVLDAMRSVPREAFVPVDLRARAYEDGSLGIGAGQTISQPYVVALMIEQARIRPGDRVLEVGAGSGYAAAVLGRIAGRVFAIERHEILATAAAERLARLGCDNVEVRAGDGTEGLPDQAPFDAIIVSAAGPGIPDTLTRQLVIGGRLIIPVGARHQQRLLRVTRISENVTDEEDLGAVAFVPLIGAHGWSKADAPPTRGFTSEPT